MRVFPAGGDRPRRPAPLQPARPARGALGVLSPADVCLVDGFKLGPTAPPHRAIVDGDAKSAAIAAASIIAKVTRDRYMRAADALYPGYGFASHVGYITQAHTEIVRERGPCEIHRRSWRARAYLPRRRPQPRNDAERRAARWYRLRGYRILDTNCWLAGAELDVVARRGRVVVLLRGEVEERHRLRRPARDGRRAKGRARAARRHGLARAPSRARRPRRALRRDRRARRAARAPGRTRSRRQADQRGGELGCRGRRRRSRSTRASTSISRGPSASCPSACGRSTSTASTRTSASTSRSSSRSSSAATCPRAGACSIRSPGSGTTLVQALESGLDSVGVDIAAFNCLLMRVKTGAHDRFGLEHDLRDALARFERGEGERDRRDALPAPLVRARGARSSCCASARSPTTTSTPTCCASFSRARRARRGARTHFDLDFPKTPQLEPYWCHKHRRECRPVEHAEHFLRRYTLDTLTRLKEFARVRGRGARRPCCTATRASSSCRGRSTRSSPRRRIRG